jgi:hypothetical protein
MKEPATVTENIAGNTHLSLDPDLSLATLEQRVQKLEERVVVLQDTNMLEERIVERLTQRLESTPAPAEQITKEPPRLEPERQYFPAAPLPHLSAAPWILFDVLKDLKNIIAMFLDIRYHVAWSTRAVVFVLVPLILISHWWFPLAYLPVAGQVLANALNLFLAFFLFKFLSRDAQRYHEYRGRR